MLGRILLERLTGRAAKVKVTAGTSAIQKASSSLFVKFNFYCNQTNYVANNRTVSFNNGI
jgi:hypothetical protein